MWAQIDNGTVVEITDLDPTGRFHPSMQWVACGAEVGVGWNYGEEGFKAPQPISPTYEEELAVLSADYQKDVDALNRAWATALLADGPNEAAKLAAIRAQYLTRKDQYSADYTDLRNKYQK